MKKIAALLLALVFCFSCAAALADSVTLSGSVVAVNSITVSAPIGGTVDEVPALAGMHVDAGDTLATLAPTVVYAQEDGVARVFGQPGDDTEVVAARYGAVVYVEPGCTHTISASTRQAYDAESNRIIHPGEKVYLRSYSDSRLVGEGTVTVVSGTSFTVEITSGSFSTGESVNVFRENTYLAVTRIGRGSVAHNDPKAYTGTGSIVRFLVQDGNEVHRGDALFETLPGQFDRLEMTGTEITASVSGIVNTVSATAGSAIEKGAAVAQLYPDDALRIEISVSETNLRYLPVGSRVTVEFPYLQENIVAVEGTVERVSFLADGTNPDAGDESVSSDESYYLAYISFAPTDGVRCGMTAVVTSSADAPATVQAAAE